MGSVAARCWLILEYVCSVEPLVGSFEPFWVHLNQLLGSCEPFLADPKWFPFKEPLGLVLLELFHPCHLFWAVSRPTVDLWFCPILVHFVQTCCCCV